MSANAPQVPELVKVTVDGRTVEVPKGLLIVEAAKRAGVEIPVFCYHPKLEPAGVCRMCLVEVEGQRKPLTACTTPVADGMIVKSSTPLARDLQRGVLELLLLNHPLDCPVCDKGGECDLQDLTYGWGPATSRMRDPKLRKRKAVDLGPYIVFDEERCILCRRCVRFDDEIAQERTLVVEERAHFATITTPAGVPYDSYFGGNTIDLCPVGALTSRLYRFKARPWDLTRVPSICTGCSVGCGVRLDFRQGTLMRVVPRENRAINDEWICDRGRFNYQYLYDDRVERPLVRRGERLVPVPWGEAVAEAGRRLRQIIQEKGPEGIGFIGGGRLTNEEAYLFQKLARTVVQTPHVDHRVGAQTVASLGAYPGTLADIDAAQVIVVIDALPAETAPVLDLRIRRAAARAAQPARLAVVGAALPEYRVPHAAFPVRPGETAVFVDALAAEVCSKGGGKPSAKEGGASLPEKAVGLAQALAGAARVVIVWNGADPEAGRAIAALAAALANEPDGRTVHVFVPGEQANSRGAEAMGVRPDFLPGWKPVNRRGLDTGGMLQAAAEGRIEALYVVSANLLATYPDGELVQRAISRVPLLIVQDLFLTQTAAKAHIVFPAAPFTAKSGQLTGLDGTVQPLAEPLTPPGGDSRTDRQIFEALSQAVGGPRLLGSGHELLWEIQQQTGWPAAEAVLPGAPREALDRPACPPSPAAAAEAGRPDSIVALPIPRLLTGGGTAHFDSAFRQAAGDQAIAIVHPEDADRLGVGMGDALHVKGKGGEATYVVHVATRSLPGYILVPTGVLHAPANRIVGSVGGAAVRVERRVLEEVG